MSSHPESSERSAPVPSPDVATLGAQLSEVMNKFSELTAEMAAQRRVIDQLVLNSASGVRSEPVSNTGNQPEPENPPPHISTTFVPPVTNPQEGTFTYFNPVFSHTFQGDPSANPAKPQTSRNHPNISSHPQGPHHPITEPFTLDTAFQAKAEIEEPSAPINKHLLKRLDRFDEFLKKSQGLNRLGGLDYDELCLFPDMHLPMGFKTPKFSKYDGTGNPKTHLRMFANKLGKPVDDENLPVRLFPESLEGDALDWYSNLKPEDMKTWLELSTAFVRQYEYNCELAPTRTTLEGTKRKPSEDHKTYAKRWRKLAAKVEPPMTEEEIVRTFIKAQDPPYFEEIFRMTGCTFADIVNKLEEFDEFVKAGKIVNVSTLKMQVDALQGQNNGVKKPQFKKEEGEGQPLYGTKDHRPDPDSKTNPFTLLLTQSFNPSTTLPPTLLALDQIIQTPHHLSKYHNQPFKLAPTCPTAQGQCHQTTKPTTTLEPMKPKIKINTEPSLI